MLSLKSGAAAIVTVFVAVIAYFVSTTVYPETSSTLQLILPSCFVIVTTIFLFITSSIVKGSATIETTAVAAPVKKSDTVVTNTTPGDVSTLYVGNLAYKANEKLVQEHFETVGAIKSVRLVKDKKTGRRKGFGFIEIAASDEDMFISKMNETEFMERNIIVRPANEKQH